MTNSLSKLLCSIRFDCTSWTAIARARVALKLVLHNAMTHFALIQIRMLAISAYIAPRMLRLRVTHRVNRRGLPERIASHSDFASLFYYYFFFVSRSRFSESSPRSLCEIAWIVPFSIRPGIEMTSIQSVSERKNTCMYVRRGWPFPSHLRRHPTSTYEQSRCRRRRF